MVGYEFEFLVREGDRPLTKATFLKFHEALKKRGWKQKFDPDTNGLLGSSKDDVFVITDDGINNMEIELPPTETLIESHERLTGLLRELQDIYKNLGASIIGTGVFPGPSDFDHTNCTNHCSASRISTKSFIYYVVPRRWKEHHWTHLFSGIHIWLDLPHSDIIRQLSVFNRLCPFFAALFANGPVFNREPLDILEGRNTLWMRALHSSIVPHDFNIYGMYSREYHTIFDYLDFILDAPFYFSARDGISFRLKNPATTLRDFLFSEGVEGEWGHGGTFMATPQLIDFSYLQNTTFHHSRLKFFFKDTTELRDILDAIAKRDEQAFLNCFRKFCLEVRVASAQVKAEISTAPALFLGLQNNLSEARVIADAYEYALLLKLYGEAEKDGLAAQCEGIRIADVCDHLIAVSEKGLRKRALGEEKYLAPLKERLAKRENPAQELLRIWEKDGLAGVWKARDF